MAKTTLVQLYKFVGCLGEIHAAKKQGWFVACRLCTRREKGFVQRQRIYRSRLGDLHAQRSAGHARLDSTFWRQGKICRGIEPAVRSGRAGEFHRAAWR